MRTLVRWIAIIGASGTFFCIGIAFLASRKIALAYQEISRNLLGIADGDFATPMDFTTDNASLEVYEVSHTMARMKDGLSDMIVGIRQSVQEIQTQSEELLDTALSAEEGSSNISESSSQVAVGIESQTVDLVDISQIVEEFS